MSLIELTRDQVSALQQVPEFQQNSDCNELFLEGTLRYMVSMYVDPVRKHVDITTSCLCDCGAGFGWLAFAYILSGGASAIIIEPHEKKLIAAKKFAKILQISDKCEFRNECIQNINLPDQSVDIFASIETLEHVGKKNIAPAIKNIVRVTKKAVILTAPNQMFPIVSHDAYVLFSHWLPVAWRGSFCRLFGKTHSEFNHFPSPWHLAPVKRQFKPISKVLVFKDYRDWVNHYPVYSPYLGGMWKDKSPWQIRLYLRVISLLFGRYSYWACPNLASMWIAK